MGALILKLLLPFMVMCVQDDSWSMNGSLYACCNSPLSARCLRAQAHYRLCSTARFGIDFSLNVNDLLRIIEPWLPLVIRNDGVSPRPMCEH